MDTFQAADRERTYIPSLEGIRGYAFLLVFFMHYFSRSDFPFQDSKWLYPIFLFRQTAWLTVPVFFVLSGYLISGILIDTRVREGYFKVFYCRRVLRVFPVFYLTLLSVALVDKYHGLVMGPHFWSHFLYIHNVLPRYKQLGGRWAGEGQITHLWSMGVEEQFYLLMPLLVWLCPRRRTLLKLVVLLITACFVIRFASPLLNISPYLMTFWTPTRVDAILMGAVLAIIARRPIYKRMEPFARYVALAGIAATVAIAIRTDGAPPTTASLNALLISVLNLGATAIVVCVMEQGSLVCRLCSQKWICWLGARSYGLYLFHGTYAAWFLTTFTDILSQHMRRMNALLAAIGTAFCLTLFLAVFCYRFVEQPAMNIKKRIRYGPVRTPQLAPEIMVPRLAESD
jgi:peptidoglycan/LPS O-acetylase OafA/YrhL